MAVTADTMKTQTGDANQFKASYTQRQQASQNNIGSAMDRSLNTQKQGLQNAFNQNTAAQTEATNAGQQAFTGAGADVGTQVNRNQTGLDSFADVRGLNRQEGSQQALALNRARQAAVGGVMAAQQRALAESQRQQDLLKTDYNNQVQAAIAGHDYRKAAALLDDYNNQNSWLEKQAANLAGYGNFTGYESLYGNGQAQAMRNYWIGQNPELAYNTGAISAAEYERMTGQKPHDWVDQGGGGGGYGGRDYAAYYINGRPIFTSPAPAPAPAKTYSNDTSAYWGDPYKFK